MIKKITLSIASILIVMITFLGCVGAGLSDWKLKLPNNYEMWHINSRQIVIGYASTQDSLSWTNTEGKLIGIEAHIIEFCYNDRFVGAKQVKIEGENQKTIEKLPITFYLLDTKDQKVYGPFKTEEEFVEKYKNLSISELSNWEKTNPAPKKAIFSK